MNIQEIELKEKIKMAKKCKKCKIRYISKTQRCPVCKK